MHHPTDRITHNTAFVTPVVEHWLKREIAQWVHPMKDRSDDPSHHERTLLPRSYISLRSNVGCGSIYIHDVYADLKTIAPNATMIVYEIVFGGMHPINPLCVGAGTEMRTQYLSSL